MEIVLATVVIYLLSMLVIGFVYSKKNEDICDFYLGGRKLGPFVSAMSAEASDMSSWLLMGLPGVAYLTGCSEAGWTAVGLVVGTYLNWLIIAKRLRIYSQKIGAITIPDFFSIRYKDEKHILMCTTAVITLIFFVPYTASGFSACGKLFSFLFGWDYHISMIISAIIIIAYTYSGGFLAASITDLVQSIIMTTALICIILFGVSSAGGINHVINNAKNIPGYLELMYIHNVNNGEKDPLSVLSIISLLAWGIGYFGIPHIHLRFMAINDNKKIKFSRRVASLWVIISMIAAIFIGIVGNALTRNGILKQLNGSDSETIIILIANYMASKGIFFAIFAGLVYSGILACTMSTADSQLLAASSAISENILKSTFGIKMDKKKSMMIARGTLLIIAVISIVLAWDSSNSIFRIVSFAWAGFGATFGPVMLAALFWKRATWQGATASIIFGGIMIFVWKFIITKFGGIFAIYELLPAFLFATAALVIVSIITYKPNEEINKIFDYVNQSIHKN